jgi:hypothetical protein
MGWSRARVLEVETVKQPVEECGLWTRGGLEGVRVIIADKVISIPREAILELVADEYVSKQISRFEQMTTDEAVREMMGSSL